MRLTEQLSMVKVIESRLLESDRNKVVEMKTAIRKIVKDGGNFGFLALSIVAAEISLEKEPE